MIKKIFNIVIMLLVVTVIVISAGLVSLNYFVTPLIEKKMRQIVTDNLGKRAELAQVNIKLPEAIVLIKGFKMKDSNLAKYSYSVSADEATLHIGLISALFNKRLIFDDVSVKNAVFILEKKSLQPASTALSAEMFEPAAAVHAAPAQNSAKNKFGELYIRKLSMQNTKFIFRDYSVVRPPAVIEVVNIDGEIDNFLISLRAAGNFRGTVHFEGYFNSARKGSLKVGGTIAKRGSDIDFDLKSEIYDLDLTYFSQYYANTSFTILKEAMVDVDSDAKCLKNELTTYHDARIHNIRLNDMTPASQATLFGLPTTTVIKFFNDYGGEVKFNFNIVGTLNDPKFEPGPIIKDVLSKALGDKIAARLRELPRDVVKISEKAIKGEIDIGKESKIWLDEVNKRFKNLKKDLKKQP